MKGTMLTLAASLILTMGAITAATAQDVEIGPNGVRVNPHRHYYDETGNCRVVIDHHTNRYGEDVEVRRRICD